MTRTAVYYNFGFIFAVLTISDNNNVLAREMLRPWTSAMLLKVGQIGKET